MKLRIIAAASVVLLLASGTNMIASAQSTSGDATQAGGTTNGMRISPVRTDLTMDPGTVKTITVYAQNLSVKPVKARAIISDFAASTDESGKPNITLEEDVYAPSHSLKRLAITEPSLVTLEPNKRVAVNVTINVPKNAKAGGYYGAVRFVPANDLSTGNDSGVAIATNLASLVLLKVNGDIVEKSGLESFDVRQNGKVGSFFKTSKDLKVVVRFNNSGNVQVQPFGKVRVLDRSGKVVEEHEINNTDPRGHVLPESIRRFETDLKKIGSFGKFTVEGNFGYGTGGQLITAKTSFWVVPITYMIAAGAGLLILGLLVFLVIKVMRLSGGRRRTYGRRY